VGALTALAAAILSAPSVAVPAQPAAAPSEHEPAIDRWGAYIREASARFAIPESWIRQVIRSESGGRTMLGGRPITSSAGAMGLMQLMPPTWAEMRSKYRLGSDPHDPRDNILAGTAYLRTMYDRFGYPGLFAAYNAGPGRYQEHLAGGRPLPAETLAYLAGIEPGYAGRSPGLSTVAGGPDLFVRLPTRSSPGSVPASSAPAAPGTDPALFMKLGSSVIAE
jgi:soluble lytic murein transglycosylase-like protein